MINIIPKKLENGWKHTFLQISNYTKIYSPIYLEITDKPTQILGALQSLTVGTHSLEIVGSDIVLVAVHVIHIQLLLHYRFDSTHLTAWFLLVA